jgi:hypothetical protein
MQLTYTRTSQKNTSRKDRQLSQSCPPRPSLVHQSRCLLNQLSQFSFLTVYFSPLEYHRSLGSVRVTSLHCGHAAFNRAILFLALSFSWDLSGVWSYIHLSCRCGAGVARLANMADHCLLACLLVDCYYDG